MTIVENDTITIRMCPKKIGTITINEQTSPKNGIDVNEDDQLITVKIRPDDKPYTPENIIKIPILKNDDVRYYCKTNEDWLWWEREYENPEEDDSSKLVLRHYPTINVLNPGCCHWTLTMLNYYGPPRLGFYGGLLFTVEPGIHHTKEITHTEYAVLQNLIVPGEKIELSHYFFDGTKTEKYIADWDWYNTCCITGGKIIAVNGEYDDPEITYIVEICGDQIIAKPSDFVQYEVDDWVFVHKEKEECGDFERTEPCKMDVDSPSEETELLTLINNARAEHGLNPVYLNAKLSQAANRHANNMKEACFLSHTGTDGSTPHERIVDTGYFTSSGGDGENIGVGPSLSTIFTAWMNSPPHRANILNPSFKEIGFSSKGVLSCGEVTADDGTTITCYDGIKTYCNTFGFNEEVELEVDPVWIILPLKIGDDGP